MTWAEFKKYIEAVGVLDEDEIDYIRITGDAKVQVVRTTTLGLSGEVKKIGIFRG